VINLKPTDQWRPGMTTDKLIADLDRALQFPGVSNAWTMPIKARTDMLSTGIRTPVGVKVYGKDLAEIERLSAAVEAAVHSVPGTTSAYAERVAGGYYLDIKPDRDQIARYGLSIADVLDTVASAMGAKTVTTAVEGRERYGVVVRYPRDVRSDPEDGQLVNYVYVDFHGRDLGRYVRDAQQAVAAKVKFPPGHFVRWSGQYEYLERANARLKLVVPATLVVIVFLLWLNFRRLSDTLIVLLSLPFALVGGFWLMWAMGFNLSVAAAVGFIALAGVAAETGVVMLIYLNHAWAEEQEKAAAEKRRVAVGDLARAVMSGAVDRVRPKMMTVAAIMAGLVPILWASGTGSEIMQRIAVPMIGGMVSSTVLTLAVIPALFFLVRRREAEGKR
jgi:Cu(I)/Ag(I) efflux system membrane protein CusA/SilA